MTCSYNLLKLLSLGGEPFGGEKYDSTLLYYLLPLLGFLGYSVITQWTTTVRPILKFAYACFLQPLGKSGDQKERLDKFYSAQADAYDATRARLLRGRHAMLHLSIAHLFGSKSPAEYLKSKPPGKRLVWVDIGGGTGWNIEQMNEICPIEVFDAVYLIDLCEPLLEVARKRFEKKGWKNVHCLCQDATSFFLPEWASSPSAPRHISFVSLSYSLSMMPLPFPLLDRINAFLHPSEGLLAICDFYVSPRLTSSPLTQLIGDAGTYTRHVSWLGRWFWLHWFEWDHVDLHPSRRAYVEYAFGTVKSLNGRNGFGILPSFLEGILGIPYYVGIFTKKDRDVSSAIQAFEIDGGNTISTGNSPTSSASSSPTILPGMKHTQFTDSSSAAVPVKDGHLAMPELALGESVLPLAALSKLDTSSTKVVKACGGNDKDIAYAPSGPLSSFHYQLQKHYRLPYLDSHVHKEFRSWIYGFVWEDPYEDMRHFDLTSSDEILAITSAGDNLLHYAISAAPRRLHAVDMNPCQNHLLELKLAAICALEHEDFWKLFGEGRHPDFRVMLDLKLSPFLSAHAYQFWTANAGAFDDNFHLQGYSGSALLCAKYALSLAGVWIHAKQLADAETLSEQRRIWLEKIKPVMTSWWMTWIFGSPVFMWNALGVPMNQANMFKRETSVLQYAVDTLDPVACNEHMSKGAYWYYLCLKQRYTHRSRPLYLTPAGFETLKANGAALLDNFRLHTDSIINVLTQLPPASLTIAVWMDHCDWFKPSVSASSHTLAASSGKDNTLLGESDAKACELRQAICALKMALKPKGRVFWRSAAMDPWYAQLFKEEGFQVERIGVRDIGAKMPIDGVNMYASSWKAIWPGF